MEPKETGNLSNTLIGALRVKGLTLERLAEQTGISERFLNSLLEEKFEALPPQPYVRGYLIKVAEVLGLDAGRLWEDFLKEGGAVKRSGKYDRLPQNRFITPNFLSGRFILLVLVILAILLYLVLSIPAVREAGDFRLYNLASDITYVSEPVFTVSGHVSNVYKLALNGERIYPDKDGNFNVPVSLQEGFNTLTFSFKKFLGKERTVTKQIFYQNAAK